MDNNGLPNSFSGQFFMTDFEAPICDAFKLFWPSIILLGCYFHFSQLIWKRVKKNHLQVAYERDDSFNAFIRRVSALPFVKSTDLDPAFDIFRRRAENLKDEELREFAYVLINYAQVQWRERFCIQDWNLFDINVLMVSATNNGNESANGRFANDFGVHPSFWNFLFTMSEELERVERDIPSILYNSLTPKQCPLYDSLKTDREVVKSNYEAGLIDLDGYMGKIGALSMATGKRKYNADNEDDDDDKKKKRKNPPSLDNPIRRPPAASQPARIPGRRGRPPKNTGNRDVPSTSTPPLIDVLSPSPQQQDTGVRLSKDLAGYSIQPSATLLSR